MLGIITKPFVVKGEYAKEVRKAALDSYLALKNGKVVSKKPQGRYHFEWRNNGEYVGRFDNRTFER